MDYMQQFHDAVRATGIEAPEDILADGGLHRFSSNGKRGDNAGWYILHDDGIPAGSFGCWRTDISETWRADLGRKFTQEETREHQRKLESMQQQREAENVARQKDAAIRAGDLWKDAQPEIGDHVYLRNKEVKAHGIRTNGLELIIPMRDTSGAIHSTQTISPKGEKRFFPGGRIQGCYYAIGKPDGELCIAEGYSTAASIHEATGKAVAVAFNAGNLEPVAKALRSKYPDLKLILCADDDYQTEGNTGISKATSAAKVVDGLLAVPDFGDDRPDGATDFNDMAAHCGLEAVSHAIANSLTHSEPDAEKFDIDQLLGLSNDKLIHVLSRLDPLDYDKQRDELSKRLGVRVSTLDEQVRFRRQDAPDEVDQQIVEEISPYESTVDGVELANSIYQVFKKHIVVDEDDLIVLTLWAIGTYAYDDFMVFPKLLISSPEKRCGKTTLLDVVDALSSRSLVASSITASAMFRTIEMCHPTLLIDEADTFMANNEELRGIVNSGHRRSNAFIIRSVKVADDFEPRKFSTWSPMVIAGIGSQADTIMDRSVIVNMRRKKAGEAVQRITVHFKNDQLLTRRKILRWVNDTQFPEVMPPQCSNDRAMDNWIPLFSIADQLGGEWSNKVRSAYVLKTKDTGEDESITTQLLGDIQEVFGDVGDAYLETKVLVEKLNEMEDRPWCEWKGGQPMTQNALSKQLKNFKIKSKQKRIGSRNHRAYYLDQFQDAFNRYLSTGSPDQSATTLQVNGSKGFSDIQSATHSPDVAVQNQRKANDSKGCSTVALQAGGYAEKGYMEGII